MLSSLVAVFVWVVERKKLPQYLLKQMCDTQIPKANNHKTASVHLNSVSVVCIVWDGLDGVHPAVNLHSLWHTILFLRQCPGAYLNCCCFFLLGNWNMGDKQDDSESRAGSSSNNCQERMIDSTLYYILLEKWNHLKNTVSRDLVGFWVKQINHFRYIALI